MPTQTDHQPDRGNRGSFDRRPISTRMDKAGDFKSAAESLHPISEADIVQFEPGPEPTNLKLFSSNRVSVLGLHLHTASVGIVIIKPDYLASMWWDGDAECRINGLPARSTKIYTQGEQDGFHVAGGPRRTMGVAVRRNELVETLATLRGVDPEDALPKGAALELSAEAAARFRSDINMLLTNAKGHGWGGSLGASAKDPSEAIIGLLADAYFLSSPVRQRGDRPRRSELIVRRAEERFFGSQGSPVALADLCAATGASQSTLYRAFEKVCGEPPLAYFRKRRLNNARRALTQSNHYRGAVKRAALTVGLSELGRFAVEYRQLFGECPSATLSRDWPT